MCAFFFAALLNFKQVLHHLARIALTVGTGTYTCTSRPHGSSSSSDDTAFPTVRTPALATLPF
jgi:hypothetical protein